MGPRRRLTAQEGDAFCLLEMNVHRCEMCKSIPISQDLRKIFVDLHNSGSTLVAISICPKGRSSVQTIVRKYKHHGTTQPSYRSGRRRGLCPRDELTLVRKVQINPRTTAKDLVKMLEETRKQVSISRVKTSPIST